MWVIEVQLDAGAALDTLECVEHELRVAKHNEIVREGQTDGTSLMQREQPERRPMPMSPPSHRPIRRCHRLTKKLKYVAIYSYRPSLQIRCFGAGNPNQSRRRDTNGEFFREEMVPSEGGASFDHGIVGSYSNPLPSLVAYCFRKGSALG